MEQGTDYATLVLDAKAPHQRGVHTIFFVNERIQMGFTDRGGSIYSPEADFSDNYAIPLATFVTLQQLSPEDGGAEIALERLSDPSNTPLSQADFSTGDIEVTTGSVKTLTHRVAPFKLQVQSVANPTQRIQVYAFGHNLVERPAPIDTDLADRVISATLREGAKKPSRRASSRSLKPTAKELGRQAQQELEAYRKGTVECPRQFTPRVIFGSAVSRYQARIAGSTATHMLQISWQNESAVSEAAILRRANELAIPGVPTLIGSYDIARMDDGPMRSRLRNAFDGLRSIRDVNRVLRAELWKEVCRPLHSVTNILDFLQALECIVQGMPHPRWSLETLLIPFVAVVELHQAGILHTNVSVANMVVDVANPGHGMLIGLDYALVNDTGELLNLECESNPDSSMALAFTPLGKRPIIDQHCSRPPPHDGSPDLKGPFAPLGGQKTPNEAPCPHVPFLASARCTESPPPHCLEHDLESVILSYFYILAVYRSGRATNNGDMLKWWTNGWDEIKRTKKNTLKAELRKQPLTVAFAVSLGIDAAPLARCSWELASQVENGVPQAGSILRAFRTARLEYTKLRA